MTFTGCRLGWRQRRTVLYLYYSCPQKLIFPLRADLTCTHLPSGLCKASPDFPRPSLCTVDPSSVSNPGIRQDGGLNSGSGALSQGVAMLGCCGSTPGPTQEDRSGRQGFSPGVHANLSVGGQRRKHTPTWGGAQECPPSEWPSACGPHPRRTGSGAHAPNPRISPPRARAPPQVALGPAPFLPTFCRGGPLGVLARPLGLTGVPSSPERCSHWSHTVT